MISLQKHAYSVSGTHLIWQSLQNSPKIAKVKSSSNKLHTINVKKLVGLKFGKSANKSVWQKKVWQIHPELQACMDVRLIFAIGKYSLAIIAVFAKLAKL